MSRILLIDDSEFILEIYEGKLDELGHEVESTTDGASGLRLFFDALHDHSRAFQIIITDFEMPQVTGQDILAQVLRRSPETPVIVLSSSKDPQIVRDTLCEGALDYVVKSGEIDTLVRAIEAAEARIAEALSALTEDTPIETIFLPRAATYPQPLTFPLGEVLPG